MRWISKNVASDDIKMYVERWSEWVKKRTDEGWTPYNITLMFRLKSRAQSNLQDEIKASIGVLYGTFLKRLMRYPNSEANKNYRPILVACPDYPVSKKGKTKDRQLRYLPNDGLHYGGILLVLQAERLKTGVVEHFRQESDRYIFKDGLLSRIHVQRLDMTPETATDYALKALKSRRASFDDLILYPMSSSEVRGRNY